MSAAWRASMFFPPFIYVCLIPFIFFCTQDTTVGKFDVALLGKTQKAGPLDYLKCCGDYRVFLMIFQYSACFGCELVMNNILATHFHDAFGVELVAAGALAMSFGAMNLFARSLGGILSDWCNVRWQMCGRLWAHFISLAGQAIFLFLFGMITKDSGGWPSADDAHHLRHLREHGGGNILWHRAIYDSVGVGSCFCSCWCWRHSRCSHSHVVLLQELRHF